MRDKQLASRSQGYRLLKKAWQQIKNDIDDGIDRQELLSWSIQTLMAAAGQAMQQKNPGAVVACIRQLDHMTGTGYNSHRGMEIDDGRYLSIDNVLDPVFLVKQIGPNIGWFGLERQ